MWKILLDPAVQALAFVLAVSGLGYVVWDFIDDVGDAAAPRAPGRRPQPRTTTGRRKGRTPRSEPSVEFWTEASGETRGRVRRGPGRGRRVEDMSREDCAAQAAYVREHDPASAVALEAYIRHRFGPERAFETATAGGLSRADAFAELGLREGASEAEIQSAYRKLIKRHHPDHGGSHAKAARLNQAKDLLAG